MAMALPKQEGKKILQLVCGNAIAENGRKKKIVCGNGIAEIEGIKFLAIVAMPLSKMGGKKTSGCQNLGRN